MLKMVDTTLDELSRYIDEVSQDEGVDQIHPDPIVRLEELILHFKSEIRRLEEKCESLKDDVIYEQRNMSEVKKILRKTIRDIDGVY
jgi:hypothetical protein